MLQATKKDNLRFISKGQFMTQPQEQESFTQVPNSFFDKLLEEIDTLSELKITLTLIRKISGWIEFKEGVPVRKEGDEVSFSQFVEMTGLSRPMVKQGIDAALARGSITRVAKGLSFYYQLNLTNYQGQGYESKRDAQLANARDKRFSNTTGLVAKPLEGVVAKPETGLVAKHTKEIELNKKEIKVMPVSIEPGPTTIDLPDYVSVENISKSSSRQVEAVKPGPTYQGRVEGEADVSSHIPPTAVKPKREKKVSVKAKEENPYTKDPRLQVWKRIAEGEGYKYWPTRESQKLIYDHIPPNQLDRWEVTIRSWLKKNHKVVNVEGMVKVFWFGFEAFYKGVADKKPLPVVNQVQEQEHKQELELAHANT